MKQIKISEFESKRCMLDYIFNGLGCTDLELCYSYINKDGEMKFSHWVRYDLLSHLEENQIVPDVMPRISKRMFIKKASHRTILDIEIMLDIDDPYIMSDIFEDKEKSPKFPSIREKAINVAEQLRKLGIKFTVHFTGSKSYHLSILIPGLRDLGREERRRFKEQICMVYGADLQKSSPKCLVALESVCHYRSGKPKIEVKL